MATKTAVVLLLVVFLLLGVSAEAQTVRWFLKTNATSVSVDVSEGARFVVEGRFSSLFLYDSAGNLVWGKNLPEVSHVAISPDAEHIAVAAGGKVLFFDLAGNLLWQYGESGAKFVYVDVSRDRVLGGTSGGRLVALDFFSSVAWAKPLCSGVRGLSFSPEGKQIAAAASTCVYLLDSQGNELLSRSPNDEATAAAGGRDRVAYGVRDGALHSAAIRAPSWRVATGTPPVALSMAPEGWFLMASGWDLYQVSDGGSILKQWVSPAPGQTGPISAATLSPDGSVLVFAVPFNLTLWANLPAPPAAVPTPSPTTTRNLVYVCQDGSTVDDPGLCPRAASPAPSPTSSPAASPPGPSPAASAPPRPPGPGLPSIPVVPVAAAALGIAATAFGIRWARKNREAIDRWRLQRRMRRI